MHESSSTTRKCSYQRKHPSGFLENVGVKYYRYPAKKAGIGGIEAVAIDDLPADNILCSLAGNLPHFAAIIAFGIGALTTVASVCAPVNYSA